MRDAQALIDRWGLGTVLGYLNDTFACPKTAKVAWRDFGYWALNFDLTKRNIDAWRRTRKKADKPEYRAESGKQGFLERSDL